MKIHIAARTFFLVLMPSYPPPLSDHIQYFLRTAWEDGQVSPKESCLGLLSQCRSLVLMWQLRELLLDTSLHLSGPPLRKLNWREVLSYFYVPFQLQHLIISFRWRWMCSRVSIHWNFRMNDLLVKFCWEFGFLCLQHNISLLFSEVLWILGKEFILTRALNSWLARGANAVGKGPLAVGEDLAPF